MENKYLIDLSIKYGLSSADVSKLMAMIYQTGVHDMESREFERIANFICEAKLLDMPPEELIEELKRKGLMRG